MLYSNLVYYALKSNGLSSISDSLWENQSNYLSLKHIRRALDILSSIILHALELLFYEDFVLWTFY